MNPHRGTVKQPSEPPMLAVNRSLPSAMPTRQAAHRARLGILVLGQKAAFALMAGVHSHWTRHTGQCGGEDQR